MFKEIRDRLEKITPGPWFIVGKSKMNIYGQNKTACKSDRIPFYQVATTREGYRGEWNREFDANFIANSPSDISTLLQFADEAMELMKQMKPWVSHPIFLHEVAEIERNYNDFLKRWEGK